MTRLSSQGHRETTAGCAHPGQRGRKFTEGLLAEDAILEALAIQPGQTVLDAGCGNGYMARAFSARMHGAGKVYAMDHDPGHLALVRREMTGTVIEAIEGDITDLSWMATSSVDMVFISTVLHGLLDEQRARFLSEAGRVLRVHGLLAVVEVEKVELPMGPPVHQKLSAEELIQAIAMDPVQTLKAGEHFYLQTFRNTARNK